MFHSAALKLTLWYLALIMAISLVFSVSLYRVSAADLERNARRQIGYFNNFLPPDDLNNYSILRQRQLDDDHQHLRRNLVLFNVLVLAAGGGASYLLARRTLRPIEQALASQSRFAADASHELRTPLAALQTENEVALRNPDLTKKQAVALLKSNLEEVGKLGALAEGLLRLAKQNGRIESASAVSLKDVAAQAASRLDKAAQSKKIKIIDKTKPVLAKGEQGSLVDALAVFIDNAIKYSPSGSAITLSTRGGKEASLIVKDSGQGIAAIDLPHIFERFYRTDGSRNKSGSGGYGLGLALANKIALAHGGHIEVTSTLGHGSTFTLHLPPA